jgi:hypothetical protein
MMEQVELFDGLDASATVRISTARLRSMIDAVMARSSLRLVMNSTKARSTCDTPVRFAASVKVRCSSSTKGRIACAGYAVTARSNSRNARVGASRVERPLR